VVRELNDAIGLSEPWFRKWRIKININNNGPKSGEKCSESLTGTRMKKKPEYYEVKKEVNRNGVVSKKGKGNKIRLNSKPKKTISNNKLK
jgi:hypothetical protein